MLIRSRRAVFIFLKFFGAVVILYLGMKVHVFEIGEKKDFFQDVPAKTQEDKEFLEMIGVHDVAFSEQENLVDKNPEFDGERNEYLLKFQNLCMSDISFCVKIKFNGEFNSKDKYVYLATSLYILNKIETEKQFGKDLKNQLKLIKINDQSSARRGFANWDSVTINIGGVSDYVEFLELMSHELGHVVDLGLIRGFSDEKSSLYTEFSREVLEVDDPSLQFYKLSWQSEKIRNSDAKQDDFCSSYGMTNPFEDFAECHNLYFNHNALFRFWALKNPILKKKYNFIANIYDGYYLFDSYSDISNLGSNLYWRPWDTTKM